MRHAPGAPGRGTAAPVAAARVPAARRLPADRLSATLPLALRNRLAERIVAALGEPAARHELAALAADPGAWLAPGDRAWAPVIAERARRASEALADLPLARAADGRGALRAAGRLFDAGLFFEVHEVLEPHWAVAAEPARAALQGLIQIAVGWQHLANGNVGGARSLLAEGGARLLDGRRLLGVDFAAFAQAARDAAATVPDAAPPAFPHVPL